MCSLPEDSNSKIIILGPIFHKVKIKTDFFDLLIQKIVNRLKNFFAYNPDDIINRKILTKIVKRALLETPKENESKFSLNLDGKGILFTKLFSKLGKSTTFLPFLSKKDEKYFSEYKKYLGNFNPGLIINPHSLNKIEISNEQIERIFCEKKQSFELELGTYNIDDISYENHSLFLGLILSKESLELFNNASKNNLITSLIIEKGQKFINIKFTKIIHNKIDIMFVSERDDLSEGKPNNSILEEIDEELKTISHIRIYFISKRNLVIRTTLNVHINYVLSLNKSNKNSKSIINHFCAAFLVKIDQLIKNKENLQKYLRTGNSDRLHEILVACIKFGESSIQEI